MSGDLANKVDRVTLWVLNLVGFLLILLGLNGIVKVPFLAVWILLWWGFVLGNSLDVISFAIFFWPIYIVLFLKPYGSIIPIYIDEISLLAFPIYLLPVVFLWTGLVLRSLLRHSRFGDVFASFVLMFLVATMTFEVHSLWWTMVLSFGLALLGYLLAFYWIVLRDNRIGAKELLLIYFLGAFLHFLVP